MEWLSANWEMVIVVFFCLEKIVKLSPSDKDDILVDVVWQGLTKLLKKEDIPPDTSLLKLSIFLVKKRGSMT